MFSLNEQSASEEGGFTTPDSGDETITTHHKQKDGREPEEPEASAAVEIREGGLRGWSVVLGVWILQFCTFGYTNAHGAYNDYYVREYLDEKYTSSQTSWIGSTQLCLLLSLGLVAGRAFDTGYYYLLMIGGCTLLVFSLFMLSLSHAEQYYQVFLAQGLGVGIACGITYVPGFGIIPHYFRRRRALAMGIVSSGSAVGGAIHAIMLNSFFHGHIGFHNGVRASAGFVGGLLLIANFLMKPRLRPTPRKGGSTLNDLRTFSHDVPYVLTVLGSFLAVAGIYYPVFFLQLIAVKNGIDPSTAFHTLVILNFASAVGRVTPALLVPKFGVYNIITPCVVVCGGLIFCVPALKTVANTIVFAVFYGFFSGTYVGLFAPMVASLARQDKEMGARLGICFTFTGLGGLIGSPIAGTLLSRHFIWWRPTLFAAVCTLTGALCFATSRILLGRRKGTWRL